MNVFVYDFRTMVKTAAERQRKRRALLKINPNAYKEYQDKDRKRKSERRAQMSEDEAAAFKKRCMLATRRWRVKNTHTKTVTVGIPADTQFPYRSPAAFGKARKRVEKVLPKSPRKMRAVMKRMAAEILPEMSASLRQKKVGPTALDKDTEQTVIDFYNNDSISRVMPGKADVITVKSSDGVKQKLQKRHLVMTVGEAYQTYKADCQDLLVGKSKFASLRPKNVLLTSEMPHNVCGCKYHNNAILVVECLHRSCNGLVPSKLDEVVRMCVCDKHSESCMSGECDTCGDSKLFVQNVVDKVSAKDITVNWYEWKENSNGFLSKCTRSGTLMDAMDALMAQLPRFLWHTFIKNKQSALYDSQKASAMCDSAEECLIQMDFSENYTINFQDEIQSAHWNQAQVSVYTVMIWHRNNILSKVIVSDSKEHEKRAVAAYCSEVLELVKKDSRLSTVTAVNIWTDGPSSQFKNKYIFNLLPKLSAMYGLCICWHYFATSHGKGPVDALGGNAKRLVHRQVMSRQTVITDAASFCDAVRRASSNILIYCMPEEEIASRCASLCVDDIWRDAIPVRGTMNMHCVNAIGNAIHCQFYGTSGNVKIYEIPPTIAEQQTSVSDPPAATAEPAVAALEQPTVATEAQASAERTEVTGRKRRQPAYHRTGGNHTKHLNEHEKRKKTGGQSRRFTKQSAAKTGLA